MRGELKVKKSDETVRKIADHFRGEIEAGRLREDDRLPTRVELMRTWGATHTEVAKAMSALKREGYICIYPHNNVRVASSGGAFLWSQLQKTLDELQGKWRQDIHIYEDQGNIFITGRDGRAELKRPEKPHPTP